MKPSRPAILERAFKKVAHKRRGPKLLTESRAGFAKEAPEKYMPLMSISCSSVVAGHLFEAEHQSQNSLV